MSILQGPEMGWRGGDTEVHKGSGGRDQVSCWRSLQEDQNPGIQGSLAVPAVCMPSRRPLAPLESWILVFVEAALAADLITAWNFT